MATLATMSKVGKIDAIMAAIADYGDARVAHRIAAQDYFANEGGVGALRREADKVTFHREVVRALLQIALDEDGEVA